MSSASKLANGQASGPVFQSVFFVILAHSARSPRSSLSLLFRSPSLFLCRVSMPLSFDNVIVVHAVSYCHLLSSIYNYCHCYRLVLSPCHWQCHCHACNHSLSLSPHRLFATTVKLLVGFLDATTHLCKRSCPSVRRSVGPSVRRSVRWSRVIFERRKTSLPMLR